MPTIKRWWLCGCLFIPLAVSAAVIKDIQVVSRQVKLPNHDFVLTYTTVKVGDEVDQRRISRDVKTLMGTGRFAFVDTELTPTPERDGFVLTYIVEIKSRLEKPVEVGGAEALGERKVRSWLELEVGDPVDDGILAVQTRKVLDEYHKRYYYDVKVTWKIELDETTGFARVRLTVKEGDRGSLRQAEFKGNTYQPPSFMRRMAAGLTHRPAISEQSVPPEDLQAAVKPHLWHIFSFFTKRGVYNPDELEADCDLIRALYQNRGYLDARVGAPTVEEYELHKLKAVFPITEGPQYRIGKLSMRGITLFPETNLWALVRLKTGDIASLEAINRNAADLRDYYQSRGYMRAGVKPVILPRGSEAVVEVCFDCVESSQVYARYVEIRGNTRTKDKVIRRELEIAPGEIYNQVSIKRSERILQNLGFFETVTSYPRETLDPAKNDVIFEVEEKRTGQFMIGAGYSSIDEMFGFMELTQGNFDIFGWPYFTGDGQKLRLRTQFGSQTEDYQISFVEPWFLDRKLSLGVDVYDTKRNNLSQYYNEQRIGSAVTLGKPLRMFFFSRANLTYRLEDITIFDVSTNAIPRIQDEAGSRMVSSLSLSLVHDTRDNVFVPTRGNRSTLTGRFSGGILGFDTDMYGFEGETITYLPMIFDHVLSLRGWAAVVQEYGSDDDVHIFDRLFLGGARNLRGFKYRDVCPYEDGEPIGGKSGALACAEYSIPITKKLLRFVMFYELGNVWLDAYDFNLVNYCSNIGIGARLDIPGFPVRIDYAWPLEISGDVVRTNARFNFWLGYGF